MRGSAGTPSETVLKEMPACCHAAPRLPRGLDWLRSEVRARLGGRAYSGDEGTEVGRLLFSCSVHGICSLANSCICLCYARILWKKSACCSRAVSIASAQALFKHVAPDSGILKQGIWDS